MKRKKSRRSERRLMCYIRDDLRAHFRSEGYFLLILGMSLRIGEALSMGSGKIHFGRRAAVAHSISSLAKLFGECMRSADVKRAWKAERAAEEVLYCATERLAHMGRS